MDVNNVFTSPKLQSCASDGKAQTRTIVGSSCRLCLMDMGFNCLAGSSVHVLLLCATFTFDRPVSYNLIVRPSATGLPRIQQHPCWRHLPIYRYIADSLYSSSAKRQHFDRNKSMQGLSPYWVECTLYMRGRWVYSFFQFSPTCLTLHLYSRSMAEPL